LKREASGSLWNGDYAFVIRSLMAKDFKVRYRNMSLGILWSLLNPLIMMSVMTFIFTEIFSNPGDKTYPLTVLCGLVPFNFFALAWLTGTTSLLENASLIKRVPVPRQVFPVASVLSNCMHLVIQIGLLLTGILMFGRGVNIYWLWLPIMWGLEILFVLGLAFMFSALNVFVRDTRYVVESVNTILFWLVPIFYSFARIPVKFRGVYEFNPVAALVMMMRTILLDGRPPVLSTLENLLFVSLLTFGAGLLVFSRLQKGFYEYL
jgi:lipopolysaccharide transport system permease protein